MSKRIDLWLILILIGAGFLALKNHFIIDDAFISFIYARNFAEGHGLVWTPGSTEFGYTNFLFTLIVGCLMVLGIEPLYAAFIISVSCYLASIALLYHVVKSAVTKSQFAPYAAAISLAVHYTVSAYATSGLETSMHMLLILGVYWAAFRKQTWDAAALASLALLTRLDSGLLLIPAFLYVTSYHWRSPKKLLSLYAPPFAVLGIFLLACNAFYGAPLPNTFYAKVLLPRSYALEGWIFIKTFLSANAYAPLVVLFVALFTRPRRDVLCLFSACALWLAYILFIGGDFMEFRLMVAILPLFYAACFIAMARMRPVLHYYALAIALAANISVGLFYAPKFYRTDLIGSLPVMDDQLTNPRTNWQLVGKALAGLFYEGAGEDVKLAVLTAGAIPYYSRLETVDIVGINNRWVAKNGVPASRIAGHRKIAPFSYLAQQNVNIAIPSLPIYACNDERQKPLPGYHSMPVLLIPLATGCSVVAYYLHPHPRIEQLIRSNQIRIRR